MKCIHEYIRIKDDENGDSVWICWKCNQMEDVTS